MKWPTDTQDFSLPVRDVDVGQPAESGMRLGVSGIRTVEWTQNDGSVVRLSHRAGNPLFERIGDGTVGAIGKTYKRGFVAVLPGATTGTLFNPYTLAVVQHGFKPAGALYYVLDFKTTRNVSPTDTTDWADVIVFDNGKVLINGLRMSPPLQDLASIPAGSIPYFINTGLADQYGRPQDRRVFAIARELVKSWASSGVTETLTPTEPRTESRALTIGQRIDGDTAYLGELYHGIDGWDGATEWYFRSAEIQMLLTPAYLVKTSVGANVAMTPPALATTTPFAEDGWRDITYPETPVMLMSSGTVMIPAAYPDAVTPRVAWPWSGSVSKSLEGDVYVNRTGETKSGSQDDAVVAAGVPLTYHAENSKTWTHGYDQNYIKIQTISIAPDAVINEGDVLFGTLGSIYWHAGDAVPGGSHGKQNFNNEYHSYLSSSLLYKDWEEQSGVAYIDMGAERLVDVSFSRAKTDGDVLVVTPNTSRYDYLFANPYHMLGADFSFGLLGVQAVRFDYSVVYYKHPTGHDQDPSAITEINDKINARLNLLAGRMCYIQEDRTFINSNPWYNATVSSSPTDTSALTWTTKDFIFYDPTNEVYITIEGSFSGADNAATLTVLLKVQTRHHTTTIQLLTRDYSYGDLLPEYEIGATGKYAIPSPQIRAMFAPLYREQGSFKGAHYVTQDEEGFGAAPAHLFNFRLILHTLSDVGEINELNAIDASVHFVPFNLLELLYCFVFSQDYGVGASTGQRYPVTFTTRFNDLATNFFGVPFDVAVRDGTIGDWTHALHSSFVGVHGASLHRV